MSNKIIFYTLLSLLTASVLIPFYFLNLSVAGIPLQYILFNGIILILVILSWLDNKNLSVFEVWLLALVFGFSLSIIASVDRISTIRSLGSFALKTAGVAFLANRAAGKADYRITANVFVITAFAAALLGVMEFAGRQFFGLSLNPYYTSSFDNSKFFFGSFLDKGRYGIRSTIGHPFILAAYLSFIFPLSLWYFKEKMSFWRALPAFIIFQSIVLSFTRSSLIFAVAGMMIFFAKKENFIWLLKGQKYFFIAVILSLTFIMVYAPGKIKEMFIWRYNFNMLKTEMTGSHRSGAYETTFNIIKKSPFFGVGFGNYPLVHRIFRSQKTAVDITTPDNMYLRILSETGIAGAGIFIIFFGLWMYKIYKNSGDPLQWAIFSSLTCFLLNQITADLFVWLPLQISFWFLFALSINYSASNGYKNQP